ncbi:hypothetical protein GCM10007049_26570 [Echinicola pacifica]|uniref:Homoserine dehydrogenase n=1 Tax=Echinicola pacifica TaxID=346377 RepID=A0A918Q4N3_9BACT|nr:homoserine dehydrogenase [Echinicola pacifica]GGZ31886.1 hypothetical protein GCM10007049_26570 [Echinicola pacifica]
MTKKTALFGFGVVGQGYYEIAKKHEGNLTPTCIVVRDSSKERLEGLPLSYDPGDILNGEYDIITELISDPDQAYDYVTQLLKQGKKVVSANKKMIADHLPELIALQYQYGGVLLYEAAAAAGIPIIHTLDSHYDGDQITSIKGILNGSSNYILSRLSLDGLDFDQAVKQAQENGFAEADPTLDINGSDVSSKLSILALHAFGNYIAPQKILTIGVQSIRSADIQLAKALHLSIKLIGSASQSPSGCQAYILPTFVNSNDPLFLVQNEYNAVKINSENLGEQVLIGKGAGSFPTGASVYADLRRLPAGKGYRYDLLNGQVPTSQSPELSPLKVLLRSNDQKSLATLAGAEGIISTDAGYWKIWNTGSEQLFAHQDYLNQHQLSVISLGDNDIEQEIVDALNLNYALA